MAIPSDNEKLELVFLKLGLAETDDQLQTITKNYLSPVLSILATNDDAIRTKVLELLSHLNKRLKARESVQLPVKKLLYQLNDPSASLFTKNFSMTYLKTGIPRMSEEERKDVLPLLFLSLQEKPKLQQDILLLLLVENLHLIKMDSTELEQAFQFSSNPNACNSLLEFCFNFLLLPYSASATNTNEALSCPPGLSLHSMKRLLPDSQENARTPAITESIKLSILNLIKAEVFSQMDVIGHLVIASADTKHTVATAADVELKRMMSSLDWDNMALNLKLFKLYLGQAGVHSKKPVATDKQRQPADIRLKLKLIATLSRSSVAGECFPLSIQVVYDGLFGKTNAKLQLLTLQFIHVVIDRCQRSNIQQRQAPLLFDALVKIINNKELSEDVRSMGFIGLGKLSKQFPEIFQEKLVFLQNLFEFLEKETFGRVKESIQESLIMMAPAYKEISSSNQFLMETLLETTIGSSNHRLQYVGVHFAATAFPSNHVPSRYHLLLAINQADERVSLKAHKLLFSTGNEDNKSSDNLDLPTFSSMITYVYDQAQKRLSSGKRYPIGGRSIAFPPKTFQSIILYLRRCIVGNPQLEINVDVSQLDSTMVVKLVRDMLGDDSSDDFILINKYMSLCLEYLSVMSDPFVMLLVLEVIAACPHNLSIDKLLCSPNKESSDNVDTKISWIKKQAVHTNENIRRFASEAYSIIVHRKHMTNINEDYYLIVQEYANLLNNKSFELQHGSIIVLGYLLGNLLASHKDGNELPTKLSHLIGEVVSTIVNFINNERDVNICIAACNSLGEICRRAPLLVEDGDANESVEADDVMDSDNQSATKLGIVNALSSRLTKNTPAHQLREAAVVALGRLPVGDRDFPFTEKVLSVLFTTAEVKSFELHFNVGSSLCSAALGINSPERFNKWQVQDDDETLQHNSSIKWLLEEILKKYVVHRIPTVRQAAAVWLMVLMKTKACVQHEEVRARLLDLHNAFQLLLSEPDELTQDIASKGFGIVYELADADLKKHLVDQLVDSLTGNRKVPTKVRILDQEDTPLLPGSASIQLGKTPDGSNLSTYKELCSFASDLNQPDLVYKFMQLANHHSQWNSRKGAAFGFRSIADAAREELTPYLPRIVPRLYRYTFDPHLPVRAAMTSIWNVIAPSPQKTVNEFFLPILDDLSHNLTSNVWRNREASCIALNNLLQSGVSSGEDSLSRALVPRLPELWKSLVRVADDIKETVRKAALETCKRLKKITIRLCGDKSSGITDGGVLSDILTVMLNDGLGSNVAEIKKLSLSSLVEISKLNSDVIKPCIPQMIGKLLEALSGLESPMVNYIQARGGSGVQGAVDEARAQVIKGDPLMETALRCLEQCDATIMKDVVLILVDLIKRTAGTPTKAACSYAVRTLVTSCKDDVQPYCTKLINALLSALTDRSAVVRKLHAYTIGCIALIATDDTVEKILKRMKQWYLERDEVSLHQASAVVVQAIARKSPDVLTRHTALVLPLAYYGMHERSDDNTSTSPADTMNSDGKEDENVEEMWKAIWVEFTPGLGSALLLYFGEILDLCSINLESNKWKLKIQAARALTHMMENQHSPDVVNPHLDRILQDLFTALKGRVWEGKHHLIVTLRTVCVHCHDLMNGEQIEQVLSLLMMESKRGKNIHRMEAITSLSHVISSHHVEGRLGDYWSLISPILKKEEEGSSDSDGDEDRVTKRNDKWKMKEQALESLPKVWCVSSIDSQVEHADSVFEVLHHYTTSGTHGIQLIALQCLSEMLPTLISFNDIHVDQVKKICDLMSPALCSCLGDVKYSSTREAALEVVKTFAGLIQYLSGERVESIHESLKNSRLNSNTFSNYDVVVQLLERFTST